MNGYMLDTTVFNHLVKGNIEPSSVPLHLQLFVTHVQLNEIQNTPITPSPERLQALLAMFKAIDSTRIPTASAVWGVSEYSEAEFGPEDGFFESLLAKLNEKNRSKKITPKIS